MAEKEHDRLADELEREVRDMKREGEKLRSEIDTAREDWARKRADQQVPGAVPDDRQEDNRGAPDEDAHRTPEAATEEDARSDRGDA